MRGITLDHVAVALETWRDGFPRFVYTLGGEWVSGGYAPGFSPSQYQFANGMRLELIMPPTDTTDIDFLRRFLDTNGPGPHHLTFKVTDIHAAIEEVRAAGIEPYGVNVDDPTWQEAFIHPRSAPTGTLVQLAQTDQGLWTTRRPAGYPDELPPTADLLHVAHAVADLDASLTVFRDLLGGEEVDAGEDGDEAVRWVELAWPGPGRVRLVTPTTDTGPLVDWIGGRPGRIHHLAFGVDEGVAGGAHELEPDAATGTRIRLLPRGG